MRRLDRNYTMEEAPPTAATIQDATLEGAPRDAAADAAMIKEWRATERAAYAWERFHLYGVDYVLVGLDAASLRTACMPRSDFGLWHRACAMGRLDVCKFLKSKCLIDLVDRPDRGGFTPLHYAVMVPQSPSHEETARWLLDHGVDPTKRAKNGSTIFEDACRRMSPAFVEELASKVEPDHLTPEPRGCSKLFLTNPMETAFRRNMDPVPIVRLLILRGVAARPEDLSGACSLPRVLLAPRRRELLASLEADLTLNDRIFLGLFLAGGVHGPTNTTTCTPARTITVAIKSVRTQRPGGSWSDPVFVPCEPRLALTAAATIRFSGRTTRIHPVAENHLPKLRGFRNTEARKAIAAFLGVRGPLELTRLRAARDVVAAIPEPKKKRMTCVVQ